MTGGWKLSRTAFATFGTIVAAALVLVPTVLLATAQAPIFGPGGDCLAYCPPPPPPPPPTGTSTINHADIVSDLLADTDPDTTSVGVTFSAPAPTTTSSGATAPAAPSFLNSVVVNLKKDASGSPPPAIDIVTTTFDSNTLTDGSFSPSGAASGAPALDASTLEHLFGIFGSENAGTPTGGTPTSGTPTGTDNEFTGTPQVVSFMQITAQGVDDSQISSAFIAFSIPQSKILSDNLDVHTVKLMRFHDGAWQALPTTWLSGCFDVGCIHNFRAISPGFSTYAVTALKQSATVTPTTPGSPSTYVCPDGKVVAVGSPCPLPLEKTSTGDSAGTPKTPGIGSGSTPPPAAATGEVSAERNTRTPAPGAFVVAIALVGAALLASRRRRA